MKKKDKHSKASKLDSEFDCALKHYQASQTHQAHTLCLKIVQQNPRHFEAIHLLGVLAYRDGKHLQAHELLNRALEIDPKNAFAHNNCGLVLHALQRFDEALKSFQRAIQLKPSFEQAYSNRSLTQHALKNFTEAIADCDIAISLRKDYPEAHNNRGLALLSVNRHQEAVTALEAAILFNPEYETAYYNLGVAYQELQNIESALTCYHKALQLNGNNARAFWNVALLLLLMGDYPTGWELHEWRFEQNNYRHKQRKIPQPLWLGEPSLVNKTILLHSEQGLGDTLQFCRYALLAVERGAKVVLEVQGPLVELLKCLPGDIQVVETGISLPEFDFHCPLMSLPLAFKTNLNSIPASASYLRADVNKADYWRKQLAAWSDRKRVGLVWSGGFRQDQPEIWDINERRNISLELIAQLNCPNLLFVSLQKGNPAESELLERKQVVWPSDNFLNFSAKLKDFTDTAALIENLDLVISVDTSTAHLAAAMGKPVWLLNRFDTCWRWLTQRNDSPWYDSVRIYRQLSFNDWGSVIQRVKSDLLSLH